VLEISKKQPEEKHPKKIIFSLIFMTISDYTFENQFHKFYNFVSFKSSNSKARRQVLKKDLEKQHFKKITYILNQEIFMNAF